MLQNSTAIPFVDDFLKYGCLELGKVFMHLSVISGGKTTAAFQVISHHVQQMGVTSALYYTETDFPDYYFLSSLANIERNNAIDFVSRRKALSVEEMDRWTSTISLLKQRLLRFSFDSNRPLEGLVEQISSAVFQGVQPRLIIVDSLNGLCDCQRIVTRQDRYEVLRATLSKLRELAKEFSVAFWVTHHLNAEQHHVDSPDPLAADGYKRLIADCDAGIISGRLVGTENISLFKRFAKVGGENRADVRFGHLRTDIARWEIAKGNWCIARSGLQKSRLPLMQQTYLTPNWDPESEGFVE